MDIDDSFTKPGSIPFKWEVRPGVPKIEQPKQPSCDHDRSFPKQNPKSDNHNRSSPNTPQKLRPPPARAGTYYFQSPAGLRTPSAPRTRSDRYRLDSLILGRPEFVSVGCFTGRLLRRKDDKNRTRKSDAGYEPDYSSDLETLSRWSVSTRKSISPFRESPSSASFSSYRSSPRLVSDADWAGFGLF